VTGLFAIVVLGKIVPLKMSLMIQYLMLNCLQPWASEEGREALAPLDFNNFSKKGCSLSFEWELSTFGLP